LYSKITFERAIRNGNIFHNVIDKSTGEIFSFIKVEEYVDGTKMNISKCDSVIFVSYKKEFFRRIYDGEVNIKWFGANEHREDNEVVINKILKRYRMVKIPIGEFKISNTIFLPEGASLKGFGKNSIIKLKAKSGVDGISAYRGATIRNLKLDCSETLMDLKSAILINAWHNNTSIGEEVVLQDLTIYGNYPHLQGVAIRLQIARNANLYSLIAFSKFLNINIYGFRDGVFCDLDYKGGDGISYINANTFTNITIYNCLRPFRLINSAKKEDVVAGKSTIMSNFFTNVLIQHVVGDYPAVWSDGASENIFELHIIDWAGLYLDETNKSKNNGFNAFPKNDKKIKRFN
jgi:hypothetical protein